MKQDKRTTNAARKKAAILKDAAKLVTKNTPIEKVYELLAKKYFVSTGTIYRSIIEQRFSQIERNFTNDSP